jgi:hypothetical protein
LRPRTALALILAPVLGAAAAGLAVAAQTSATRLQLPERVASREGDLLLGASPLTEGPELDGEPDWSPDHRRIAFVRARPGRREAALFTIRRDGGGLRRLTPGRRVDVQPAWSPEGTVIAYASSPVAGGSFDLYTVDVRGGRARLLVGGPADEVAPSWSADGSRLRFVRITDGAAWLMEARRDGRGVRRLGRAREDDWRPRTADSSTPRAGPRELLPDFDQRPAFRLTVSGTKLGFASATDNVGEGPIRIAGRRSARSKPMQVDQLVELSDGSVRRYPRAGRLRYTSSPSHVHWHLLWFQRFELRQASDGAVVVRDRKTGFCLADHYGLAARRVPAFRGPRFLGDCASGRPEALSVEQGTSPGYTDLYPPSFHGQNLELAGLPAGVYVLVHRANAGERLEEADYSNNAASLRLLLTWEGGAPRVHVLRTCPASDRC